MSTARAIVKSLGGMWTNNYGLVRCPCHDDRKPSLKIKDDPNKRDHLDVVCFAGCDWRDIKSELAKRGLIEASRGISTTRSTWVSIADSIPKPKKFDLSPEARTQIALQIWSQSIPLTGTLGFRYFVERRGLHIGLLDDLSHALRWYEGEQAIIGLMTTPIGNVPCGVHRTFLNPDGTKRDRRMLGKAGVIRLSRDEDVLEGLGLCEGVEDGLAVLLSGWRPVWAASCAGSISTFPILAGVESLTIFSDYDEVGMNAAVTCCDRWEAAGRETAIQEPQQENS
jgi:hypothetical protein